MLTLVGVIFTAINSNCVIVKSFVDTFTNAGKPLIFWYVADCENTFRVRALNMPDVQTFTMTSSNFELWNIVENVPLCVKELEPILSNAISNRMYEVVV